ncbi:hypothetical protein KUCAC02_011735, partial [Chaenocephalus aceratus]
SLFVCSTVPPSLHLSLAFLANDPVTLTHDPSQIMAIKGWRQQAASLPCLPPSPCTPISSSRRFKDEGEW